jgi:hypothetical protein
LRIQLKEGIGGERRPKDRVTLRITLLYENESIVQQFSTKAKDPMYRSGSNWYFERNISSQHSSMPIAYILQFARQWAQPWHFIHLQCILEQWEKGSIKFTAVYNKKKLHLYVCTVHPPCFIENCTLEHFGNLRLASMTSDYFVWQIFTLRLQQKLEIFVFFLNWKIEIMHQNGKQSPNFRETFWQKNLPIMSPFFQFFWGFQTLPMFSSFWSFV